jgi:hypothetical protein
MVIEVASLPTVGRFSGLYGGRGKAKKLGF